MQSSILALAVAAFVAATPGTATPEADLGWLAELPGITRVESTRVGAVSKGMYTADGNMDVTYTQLLLAFARHGWSVRRGRGLDYLDMELRTLRATKGQTAVRLLGKRGDKQSSLTVLVEQTAVPAIAPAAAAPPVPGAPPKQVTTGGRIELREDGATRALACADYDAVSITGSRNRFTLTGACELLEVMGNGNQVEVRGSVEQLASFGRDNVITWSPATNVVAPRMGTMGPGSRLEERKDPPPAPSPARRKR